MSSHVVDHYADSYWNDLPEVLAYMCRRATGDPGLWWMDYLKQRYATPPLERALVLACGNGWVERGLFDRGVALHFDAFDPSAGYLKQAEELRNGRAINYLQARFTDFPIKHRYDLVVNVAALHHARRLYETVQRIAASMTKNGLLVNWDYIGPSRNQYSPQHLALMEEVNRSLPGKFQSKVPLRPALRTIVSGDPSEAAHSSEIKKAIRHYFEIVEWKDLGGGIAYQILWNNISEFEKDDREAKSVLHKLLALDEEHTHGGKCPSLFAFFIARNREARPGLGARYHRYLKEPLREATSRRLMGDIYLHDILHRIGVI